MGSDLAELWFLAPIAVVIALSIVLGIMDYFD